MKDVLYQRARGLVGWRMIDARALAVSPENTFLHLINESGTVLWQRLGEPMKAADAGLLLARMFDLEAESTIADVRAFLDRLVALRLAISNPDSSATRLEDPLRDVRARIGAYAPPSVLRFRSVPRLLRRLTIPPRGVVWRSLASGSIIVEPKDGEYYATNESGDRLWRLLACCTPSYGELAEEIGRSYAKREEEILPDLIRFLKALSEAGLLEYAPGRAVPGPAYTESGWQDSPPVGEYQPPVLTPVSKLEGLCLPPH